MSSQAPIFPRPMGAVPTDAVHEWLPYALPIKDARRHFTNTWKRWGIPWSELREGEHIRLYAHQHVADPTTGRSTWCCLRVARKPGGRPITLPSLTRFAQSASSSDDALDDNPALK